MQLHDLKRVASNKTKKRVGRGGKRGKTSGRGTKGQKARAGHRMRPEARDIIKKLPKRRGYGKHRASSVNQNRPLITVVNLSLIEKYYTAGETVSPQTLVAKKIVRARGGKLPQVKILGAGALTKKIAFEGVELSGAVKTKLGL